VFRYLFWIGKYNDDDNDDEDRPNDVLNNLDPDNNFHNNEHPNSKYFSGVQLACYVKSDSGTIYTCSRSKFKIRIYDLSMTLI